MAEYFNQNEKELVIERLKKDAIFYEDQIKEREVLRDRYVAAHEPYVRDYRMEIQVEENTISSIKKRLADILADISKLENQ